MKRHICLFLLLATGLAGGPGRVLARLPAGEAGHHAFLVSAATPSEVVLEDPRIDLAEGLRIFTFHLRLEREFPEAFLFVVDPEDATVRTLGMEIDQGEAGGVPQAAELKARFEGVDWSRLPEFQQRGSWKRRPQAGTRDSRRGPPAGLIWAESHSAPGPEPTPVRDEDPCWGGIRVSIQALDREFLRLASTSAALFPVAGETLSKGACWTNGSGGGEDWFLTRCMAIQAETGGAEGLWGRVAGFTRGDPTQTGAAESLLLAAGGGAGSGDGTLGFFAFGDASNADDLMLGAVEISRGCH